MHHAARATTLMFTLMDSTDWRSDVADVVPAVALAAAVRAVLAITIPLPVFLSRDLPPAIGEPKYASADSFVG